MHIKKSLLVGFAWIFVFILGSLIWFGFFSLPSHVTLIQGERFSLQVGPAIGSQPVTAKRLKDTEFEAKSVGVFEDHYRLFGKIPIKKTQIEVLEQTHVIPCGNTIGVKIETDGVLVIGTDAVVTSEQQTRNPAQEADLQIGDLIVRAQNHSITNTDQLKDIIAQSKGAPLSLTVLREDKEQELWIQPLWQQADQTYHIGAWVRDSAAGIGTMTFYDPQKQRFAALGHGITDMDTNDMLRIGNGEIVSTRVTRIKKGEAGNPGELQGHFTSDMALGTIDTNTDCGVFGTLYEKEALPAHAVLPLASHSSITVGPAEILCTLHGEQVASYQIEIEKVSPQAWQSTKGMVIRMTDPELIAKSGGIVQGMSGSPIIQNGKLVGAVTHVFVNDPTRGYGIFIENMLSETEK